MADPKDNINIEKEGDLKNSLSGPSQAANIQDATATGAQIETDGNELKIHLNNIPSSQIAGGDSDKAEAAAGAEAIAKLSTLTDMAAQEAADDELPPDTATDEIPAEEPAETSPETEVEETPGKTSAKTPGKTPAPSTPAGGEQAPQTPPQTTPASGAKKTPAKTGKPGEQPTPEESAETSPDESQTPLPGQLPPKTTGSEKAPSLPPKQTSQSGTPPVKPSADQTPKSPPKVTKKDLKDIGPQGRKSGPSSVESIAPSLVPRNTKPKEVPPTNQKGIGTDLNSQKQNRNIKDDKANQLPDTNQKQIQPTIGSDALDKMRKEAAERENRDEEAYQKMNFLQKRNRVKQQKKILKDMQKKNDELIGMIEHPILFRFFPIVTEKIILHQTEVGETIKKLSKKKTIYRKDALMDKLFWETMLFSINVLEPTIKSGYVRDSIRRFRNWWFSWAFEFYWWTIILAVFDMIVIYPIFLLMTTFFDGIGVRLLKKVKKRSGELHDMYTKLNQLAKPKGGDNRRRIGYQKKSWED